MRTSESRCFPRFALPTALTLLLATPTVAHAKPKGPWAQMVTDHSAEVRVEPSPGAGAVAVRISPVGHPELAKEQQVPRSAVGVVLVAPFEGLSPATSYRVTVTSDGIVATGAFVTAPASSSQAPVKFLVYGDNRTDAVAHRAIVAGMAREASDFLVHTGDYVDVGGQPGYWDTFFSIEAPLIGQKALIGTVGNHELFESGGGEWLSYFGASGAQGPKGPDGAPLLDFTVRWGSIRFFMLNGFVGWKSGPDRDWLEAELAKADAESDLSYRIVVTHHSPYSSGLHGNNDLFAEAGLPELLVRHKVDLVVAGHDHSYERGFTGGLRWIVSGGGGAPLYGRAGHVDGSQKFESTQHFLAVTADRERLTYVAKRIDGSMVERCGIVRGAPGWLCGDALLAAPAPAAGASTPALVPVAGSAAPTATATATAPTPVGAVDKSTIGGGSRCGCAVGDVPASPGLLLPIVVVLGVLRRRSEAADAGNRQRRRAYRHPWSQRMSVGGLAVGWPPQSRPPPPPKDR